MDTHLLSIIEAAEAGAPTPGVNVVTNGGDWIRGQPCSSNEFRDLTWPHYVNDIDQVLKKRPRRERKVNPQDASAVAAEPFAAVTERRDGSSFPALTLSQATLSFGGRGDGMNLAAVRVPVDAVSSWWISGGSYIKADSGSAWLGGVVFPVGN